MIITCNNCNSRFNIDEKLIKPQGSKVKCSKCQTIFMVYPPPAEEEILLPPPEPPAMPSLLDDDEYSGVDIAKDFVSKPNRPPRKPMFEEPDVVGGTPAEEQPVSMAASQVPRAPRRVPARSAGASASSGGGQRGERPVRSTQRRPAPTSAAANTGEPPRRTMAPPVTLSEPPETKVEEATPSTVTDETFAEAGKTVKSGKGKHGAKPVNEKPVKEKKERSGSGGGLKKLLLLILIVILLLVVIIFALPKAGIEVPFLDKLNISQLLGGGSSGSGQDKEKTIRLPDRNTSSDQQTQNDDSSKVEIAIQDTAGIQHFYINRELVNAGILGNTSSGIVIIVEGLLQNSYDEPRKAIKIVGRLYNEKYELEQEKIVYAGNLLTEEELVSLNPVEIENRLFTNGREATVPAKSSVPFMIVFSNIPEPISNYTYECELVSSESAVTEMPVLPQPTS